MNEFMFGFTGTNATFGVPIEGELYTFDIAVIKSLDGDRYFATLTDIDLSVVLTTELTDEKDSESKLGFYYLIPDGDLVKLINVDIKIVAGYASVFVKY